MEEAHRKILNDLLTPFEPRYKRRFKSQFVEKVKQQIATFLHELEAFLWQCWAFFLWFYQRQQTATLFVGTVLGGLVFFRPLLLFGVTMAAMVGLGYLSYGLCFLLEKLTSMAESYVHFYFGQDIDSTKEQDLCFLLDFLSKKLSAIPQTRPLMTLEELRNNHETLERLLAEAFTVPGLSPHLGPLAEPLKDLWQAAIATEVAAIRKQATELSQANTVLSREGFIAQNYDYEAYRRSQQKSAVLTVLQGGEWQHPALLRDKILNIFLLPQESASAHSTLDWADLLCTLLKEECTFLYGPESAKSPDFEQWIWWVRDCMSGLKTAPPQTSCPYFASYNTQVWEGVDVRPPSPIILSSTELFYQKVTLGESYGQREEQSHSMA